MAFDWWRNRRASFQLTKQQTCRIFIKPILREKRTYHYHIMHAFITHQIIWEVGVLLGLCWAWAFCGFWPDKAILPTVTRGKIMKNFRQLCLGIRACAEVLLKLFLQRFCPWKSKQLRDNAVIICNWMVSICIRTWIKWANLKDPWGAGRASQFCSSLICWLPGPIKLALIFWAATISISSFSFQHISALSAQKRKLLQAVSSLCYNSW